MKILYGARMARYDLLHFCQVWACNITRWTERCDQRRLRIVSYIHHHIDVSMFGWIADTSVDLRLLLYTDADFAADTSTLKTSSGVCCAISGPTSCLPLCASSKKQRAVSHSTAQSEMVAADLGFRTEALPLMTLFDAVLKRQSDVCSSKTIKPF